MGTAGSVQKPLKSKRSVEKTIKTEKKLESLDIQHYDKDNLHLLHDMFLGLDPTMRVYLEEKRGAVYVSTYFDRRAECLKLKIHQVTGIRTCSVRADTCDPYFKVFLIGISDEMEFDSSVFNTRVAEQTLEAVYDELFQFAINPADTGKLTLVIELWDFSELIEPGEQLGSVHLPVSQLLERNTTGWHVIRPTVNPQAGGDVQFCTHFSEEDSLLRLSGLRTENLRVGDGLCVMCRILLTRKDKFYETVENPAFDKICCWDDEFCFKVPKDDLFKRPHLHTDTTIRSRLINWQTSILITVFSVNGKGERQCLGQAIVPLAGLELNKDIIIRRPLADLTQKYRKNRENLSYAHVLHELRDAYVAHTVAKAPQAVFGGALLTENKRVKLSCRKAGCTSRRVLYEGKLCRS